KCTRIPPRDSGLPYTTRFRSLRAYDRKWLLKDLSNLIAQQGVNILALASRVDPGSGLADLRIAVRVADFGQLSELLGRLNAVPGDRKSTRLNSSHVKSSYAVF